MRPGALVGVALAVAVPALEALGVPDWIWVGCLILAACLMVAELVAAYRRRRRVPEEPEPTGSRISLQGVTSRNNGRDGVRIEGYEAVEISDSSADGNGGRGFVVRHRSKKPR